MSENFQLLIGKNAERESPNTQAINNMYNEDEFPPYYVNGPNSAQVNMTSAISLLCRYCTSLSNDQYTIYAPEWYLEKNELGIRVVILLPIVCPIIESIKVSCFPYDKFHCQECRRVRSCATRKMPKGGQHWRLV